MSRYPTGDRRNFHTTLWSSVAVCRVHRTKPLARGGERGDYAGAQRKRISPVGASTHRADWLSQRKGGGRAQARYHHASHLAGRHGVLSRARHLSSRCRSGDCPKKDAGWTIPNLLARQQSDRVNHIGTSTGEGHDEAVSPPTSKTTRSTLPKQNRLTAIRRQAGAPHHAAERHAARQAYRPQDGPRPRSSRDVESHEAGNRPPRARGVGWGCAGWLEDAHQAHAHQRELLRIAPKPAQSLPFYACEGPWANAGLPSEAFAWLWWQTWSTN